MAAETPDTPVHDGGEDTPRQVVVGESGALYTLYRPLSVAGKGSFGQLWTGQHTARDGHHRTVAVKMLDPGTVAGADAARREFDRGRDRGPHVVRYLDHSPDGSQPAFVVMDYLPGQNLQQWVTAQGALDGGELAALLVALASALECLYSDADARRRSYHGDLAPKNVMRLAPTDTTKEARYVVLDFGHGHRDDTVSPTSIVNPARYVTPEANIPIHSLKVHPIYTDVHLAAQVVLYALDAEHPTSWEGTDVGRDLPRIATKIPVSTPAPLRALLGRMLTFDIATRAKVADVDGVVHDLREIAADLSGAIRPPHGSVAMEPRVTARTDLATDSRAVRLAGTLMSGLAWTVFVVVAGVVTARLLDSHLDEWHLVTHSARPPQRFVVALLLSWGTLVALLGGVWLIRRRWRRRRSLRF